MFVDLNQSRRRYKGRITIAYTDTGGSGVVIRYQDYQTGKQDEDIKYNQWRGSWTEKADSKGVVEPRFVAIFENKSVGAVVLHINEVVKYDVGDGEVQYKGYGDVWFKAFRTYRKNDRCFSTGTYINQASNVPPIPSGVCWNRAIGPYSCLPSGIRSMDSIQADLKPDVRELDLECYVKLGEFGNLDIHEAFNLNSDDRITILR